MERQRRFAKPLSSKASRCEASRPTKSEASRPTRESQRAPLAPPRLTKGASRTTPPPLGSSVAFACRRNPSTALPLPKRPFGFFWFARASFKMTLKKVQKSQRCIANADQSFLNRLENILNSLEYLGRCQKEKKNETCLVRAEIFCLASGHTL